MLCLPLISYITHELFNLSEPVSFFYKMGIKRVLNSWSSLQENNGFKAARTVLAHR